MPRFIFDLPIGTLVYGLDISDEWFAEIEDEAGRIVERFDVASSDYDHVRPVRGLLCFIARSTDLFDGAAIDEAALGLVAMSAEQLPEHLQVVGRIITDLRAAADQ